MIQKEKKIKKERELRNLNEFSIKISCNIKTVERRQESPGSTSKSTDSESGKSDDCTS